MDKVHDVVLEHGRQLSQVYSVMQDGKARTLWEWQEQVRDCCGAYHSQTAISARIRDLRKAKYGAYHVETKKRSKGVYEYRLIK